MKIESVLRIHMGMTQVYTAALEQLNKMHIGVLLLSYLRITAFASCSVLLLFLHYVLNYIRSTKN